MKTAANDLMQWFLDQNDGCTQQALIHACVTLIATAAYVPKGMLRLPPAHAVKAAKTQPKSID